MIDTAKQKTTFYFEVNLFKKNADILNKIKKFVYMYTCNSDFWAIRYTYWYHIWTYGLRLNCDQQFNEGFFTSNKNEIYSNIRKEAIRNILFFSFIINYFSGKKQESIFVLSNERITKTLQHKFLWIFLWSY